MQIAGALLAGVVATLLVSCAPKTEQAQGDAASLVRNAWMAYRLGEYQNAIQDFTTVRSMTEKGSDEWAMATYGLGITWDLRRPGENPRLATQLYHEVLNAAADAPIAPWAELALARQLHLVPVGQEPDYDAVNAAYQKIVDTYPDHLAAKEAFLYLESIQLAKLEPVSSKASAERLLNFIRQDPGKAEFVGPAYSLLSVAYVTLDDQENRLHVEQEAFEHTETDPTDPSVEFAWAYWNLATIAEFEVGDFDLARSYYTALIKEYPNDIRVHGSKQALKRMDALEARLLAEEEER
jgi:tetratricopeptide (TPR) repeat protein